MKNRQPSITLSHSSAQDFEMCPRLYELRYVRRLACASDDREAAIFGSVLHKGLAAWHRHGSIKVALGAMHGAWPAGHEPRAHLTPGFAVQLLEEYVGTYGRDEGLGKALLAEREFRFELGTLDGVTVWYAGTLDLVVADAAGHVVVVDHKTSALTFTLWLAGQRVSAQWPGYVRGAAVLTRQPCNEVLVNYMNTRPKCDARFQRAPVLVSEEMAAEWTTSMLALAKRQLDGFTSGSWPLARSACTRQWGRPCEFFSLCEMNPDTRDAHVKRCASFSRRPLGPTEKVFPLGLAGMKGTK